MPPFKESHLIKSRLLGTALLGLFLFVFAGSTPLSAEQTALDRYVHQPDAHYQFQVVDKSTRDGYTSLLVRMTSQQWRTEAEVSPSIWRHWMRVYVPAQVSYSTAMLYIRGGATSEAHPDSDPTLAAIATSTHSIVAELLNVPNEPTRFTGDPRGDRTEDEIIAYTWRKFMETGDETWPLRLPMTKAAVRAMDTITSIAASDDGGHRVVDHFFVLGASKRGWTTWTTAAVDPRVVAIAPMVIDVLNVRQSFLHHYRSYGFWAPAVKSYFDEGIMDQIDSPAFARLMQIEDPYSYRDRLTMPKLIIHAAGDQFFLPDSSRYYFQDLPGENNLLAEPNTDHSLRGSNAVEAIGSFYQSILEGGKRPHIHWTFEPDGAIRLTTEGVPARVTLWQASNPQARDFRLERIGAAYHSSELKPEKAGLYIARVPRPAKGWTAFFITVDYPGPGAYPFHFSTQVRVLPDTEPFASQSLSNSHLEPASQNKK